MRDWPLIILLVCIGIIIYLFLAKEDEDYISVDDEEIEASGLTLREAEYYE
jgi:hypothetical protein